MKQDTSKMKLLSLIPFPSQPEYLSLENENCFRYGIYRVGAKTRCPISDGPDSWAHETREAAEAGGRGGEGWERDLKEGSEGVRYGGSIGVGGQRAEGRGQRAEGRRAFPLQCRSLRVSQRTESQRG